MADQRKEMGPLKADLDVAKRTILLYSPDLNFCFSLSVLFQDRYNVVTTTNLAMVEEFAGSYTTDLVMLDAVPSAGLLLRIDSIRRVRGGIPILMMYVYSEKDEDFDRRIRERIDSVFYKPLEIAEISRRVSDLLPT